MNTSEKSSPRFQRTNLSLGFVLLSATFLGCEAWTPSLRLPSISSQHILRTEQITTLHADTTGNGIQTVDLGSMEDDHEKEGQLMADSIVAWLDVEWMPQQVHIDMAECAKNSYIQCREAGQNDVMDVMMQISNDLDKNWAKYNDDAFVNAWDIGNYCSDYLVKRSGNEGCACSSEIF
mmetsp:Transcript_5490/g.11333  ORF Transcript_5490/g.11333 Transcript_5490/m.11333 type:complete len:178 (+) Transcript_5490:175-708(+)